jgi:pilus assembly protein CpaF
VVVHVGTDAEGRRRVREIVAVPGRAEGGIVETADVSATRDGRLGPCR